MDKLILGFDKFLRLGSGLSAASRQNPAEWVPETELSAEQRSLSAGLMRVNHVGEICAQALYDSQAIFAKTELVKQQFRLAAIEEQDHLAWTAQRLSELGSRPSLLNPLWYVSSFAIGAAAARLGDANSLGFVVETEKQVEAHLASHLEKLPQKDAKSRAIVHQMRIDEAEHGKEAQNLGATNLPFPVKALMRAMAKVMTTTAYYI